MPPMPLDQSKKEKLHHFTYLVLLLVYHGRVSRRFNALLCCCLTCLLCDKPCAVSLAAANLDSKCCTRLTCMRSSAIRLSRRSASSCRILSLGSTLLDDPLEGNPLREFDASSRRALSTSLCRACRSRLSAESSISSFSFPCLNDAMSSFNSLVCIDLYCSISVDSVSPRLEACSLAMRSCNLDSVAWLEAIFELS